jgi:hypothetical protein
MPAPVTAEQKDAIHDFLEETYNPLKHRLMLQRHSSASEHADLIQNRLEKAGCDYGWRSNYWVDISSAKKYSTGLSARRAIWAGIGHGWANNPVEAYVMVALAFCGIWKPDEQDPKAVLDLLKEIFKLKTANMQALTEAVRENKDEILGEVENQIWLHLIALQADERFDFTDADVAENTALSVSRIAEMQAGSLLKDYELASLAEYLNKITQTNDPYTQKSLSDLQLRVTNLAAIENA